MAKQISEPISFNGMKREYVRLGPSPSLTKLIRKCERDMLAITYDDITLRTRHSEVGPAEADLSSFFSTNVPLITPQVSAAMSDVTEKDMAIAMANNGGLGIIHNHLSPKEQADQVSAVKHFLNALIDKPIYFNNRQTIGDILEKCARKRWKFRDFPIVNDRDQLIGFIYDRTLKAYTKRPNMRIEDVMCKVSEGRVKTATPGTTLKRAYELMINLNEAVLPLVNKKGELVGMYSMADINRILFENKDNSIKPNVDIYGRLFVGASVGVLVSEGTEERIELLVKAGVDVIEVKQANVNTKIGLDTIRYIKKHFDVDVAAGNIDNPEGVKPLLRAGADAIGIGVGPGSICKTRKVAGSGTSQVTAVAECAKETGYEKPIYADGGGRYSGDFVKAFAVGAQSFMAGGLYSVARESPAEITYQKGESYKIYKGMGSRKEMEKHPQSKDKYGQGTMRVIVEQGEESLVPFSGKEISEIVAEIDGGIRSGMSFSGARNLPELHKRAAIIRITNAGETESKPHDVTVISGNYGGKQR